MFLGKLEAKDQELDEFKTAARESDKVLHQEIKQAKEEHARAIAERDEQISRASSELNEVREARDTLI